MKRLLLLGICISLLLAGCGGTDVVSTPDKASSAVNSSSETEQSVGQTDTPSTPEVDSTVTESTVKNSYEGVDRTVLGSIDQLKMDYKKLPDIEGITPAQIEKCMLSDGMEVSVTKDPAFKAPDATAAIKMTVNKNKASGQVIFAEKLKEPLSNGLDEAIVLDPVDGSLEGYEGIRYFVKVKRPEGKKYSELKIRFFFGSYSYYRSMYEYTVTLPDGDFEGYIDVPFKEMVNGYNGNTAVSITNIAYFAFNIQLEGNAEDLEVYVSDFQAYRELYW